MVSPHRYSSHALILLAMLFVTGCFAAASVMSLAGETAEYPFQKHPPELLNRIAELKAIVAEKTESASDELADDVKQLLVRTDRGETLGERELVDAFLIASGVFDRQKRDQYAGTLDKITADARQAITASKTPAEQGDALLSFLHKGPMKAGYDAEQTRLSVLLDTGKYNCVSSTALFQIVARRLGLDSHAISIPGGILAGHAMCSFADGDRQIDVETTNPDGFDFRAKVKESGATVIGIQLDPKEGHEVSDLGLASLIAQNLACGSGKKKEPLVAIEAALVGLALDPHENAKANNFVAAVNDWAMALGDANKFDDALRVMQFGFELLPAEETLKNNADILWTRYAVFEARAGRAAEAVAIVRRAIGKGQLERPDEAEASPFIHVAEDSVKATNWQDAIATLDRGLSVVDEANARELRKWLVQVHRQWSESERKGGNNDAAISALVALSKKVDDQREVQEAVEYFAQESLAEVERASGPAAAAKLLTSLRQAFPKVEYLGEAGKLCARRGLEKLLSAKKFEEAQAAIKQYQPLLEDDAARDEVGGLVMDHWGRELVREKNWQQAVKVYGDGLMQYPTSDLLKNNAVVAWDQWAGDAMKKKDWKEAIRIYELALEALGDNAHLRHNLEVCRKRIK